MSKVLKASQAKEGEAVIVNARSLEDPLHPAQGEGSEAAEEGDESGAAGMYEDEPLLSEAEQRAQEILKEAALQAQQTRAAAQEMADRMLVDAQVQANELIAQTQRVMDQARVTLEREIRTALEAEYSGRYLSAVTALEGAAEQLREQQEDYLAQIEQPAFQLVQAIARQLIGSELSHAPQFIAHMIAQAFLLLKPEQVVFVAVDPLTFQHLIVDDMLHAALSEHSIKQDRVELEIEEALKPGQFCLRISGVQLDYDLASAIADLQAHLTERAAAAE